MRFEQSIDIAAPQASAWAVVSDVERWPDCTASVTSVELQNNPPFGLSSIPSALRICPSANARGKYAPTLNVPFVLTVILLGSSTSSLRAVVSPSCISQTCPSAKRKRSALGCARKSGLEFKIIKHAILLHVIEWIFINRTWLN
jgi:hypothetical protein